MSFVAEIVTSASQGIDELKALYKAVFPKEEQVPLWILFWRARKKFVEFIRFVEDGKLIGFTYTITHDNLTYVFYLAVQNEMRSQGYGSRILRHIEARYPANRLSLEIENPEQAAENGEQRRRRLAFYLKNGFEPAGYKTVEGRIIYRMLTKNGCHTASEHTALMARYHGLLLRPMFKPKFLP